MHLFVALSEACPLGQTCNLQTQCNRDYPVKDGLSASAKCCGRGEEQRRKSEERFTKFLAWVTTEKTEGFATALCDRQWRVGLVSARRSRRKEGEKRVLFQLGSAATIKGWHNTDGGIKINDSCFGTNGISAVFSHPATTTTRRRRRTRDIGAHSRVKWATERPRLKRETDRDYAAEDECECGSMQGRGSELGLHR